jgi:hypothetical protein
MSAACDRPYRLGGLPRGGLSNLIEENEWKIMVLATVLTSLGLGVTNIRLLRCSYAN